MLDKKIFKERINLEIKIIQVKIEELKEATKSIASDVAIGRISRMNAINNKSANEAA
jgi:DnaK suppressor protein